MNESVELVVDERGVPAALRWGHAEYQVVDVPTPLEVEVTFVTHPPPARPGWRFTGRSADDVRVFDIIGTGSDWRLLHVYA